MDKYAIWGLLPLTFHGPRHLEGEAAGILMDG
jgi:hypothetical protein